MISPESSHTAQFGSLSLPGRLPLARIGLRTFSGRTEVRHLGPFGAEEMEALHRRAAEYLREHGHDENAYAVVRTPLMYYEVYVPATGAMDDTERALALADLSPHAVES